MSPEQINVALAKAMGWSVAYNERRELYELLTPKGKWEYPYDADGEEAHCWKYVPDYLTDSNAALEVVEMMRGKGFAFTARNKDGEWLAGFAAGDGVPAYEFAATLPLAICAAACKALQLEP